MTGTARRPRTPPPESVHRLKVTLREVRPPVWRRIAVPGDFTLAAVAATLEAAFGWSGYHLHVFEAGGVRYGDTAIDADLFDRDERSARLAEVLPAPGARLRWEYDFGDGWEHDIVVEAIVPAEPGVLYPRCLTGRRACPPEDCGGAPGYDELRRILADPADPEHAEMAAWIPEGFDPAHFDPAATTLAMLRRHSR